ncbi:MAG: T9SS type A sorting domain-containing protein [Ignavibacteria bacterium]
MRTLEIYFAAFFCVLSLNNNLFADGKRIPVCESTRGLFLPSSEKSNINGNEDGTVICWLDERNNGSLCVQKMNADNNIVWKDNGVMLDSGLGSGFTSDSDYPLIFSDNEGGAVIIYRKIFDEYEGVYMIKIYRNGEQMKNPVCLSSFYEGYNYSPSATLTGNNEIIVVWENFNEGDFDIHAQKIDLNGKKLWNNGNEIVISAALSDQRKPTIACNENNVVFITWLDARDHSDYVFDLFACTLDNTNSNINKIEMEKKIFRNDMISHSRKAIFYNHNVISSEKNSFLVTAERFNEQLNSSDIIIIKTMNDLDHVKILDLHSGSYQSHPLMVKISENSENGAYIIWNEKDRNQNTLSAGSIDADLNLLGHTKGELNITCEITKNSNVKILPSETVQNGICTGNRKLLFTWVNSFTGKLYATSLRLTGESVQCNNTFEIQDKISEGECTSITYQRNSVVIVYKQSNKIFAKVRELPENSLVPPENETIISNFPNPFNPSTKIFFSVPSDGFVRLNVYDVSGKLMKILVNEFKTSGEYETEFNGSFLPSGVYFYRLFAKGNTQTKRMMMIK